MTRNGTPGTLADIGGYSLNYHKHIHCGEGGIIVTDDDRLAERTRLIRNHAEEVSGLLGLPDHVFPVAGLGVGIPATPAFVSARLPLCLTVHLIREPVAGWVGFDTTVVFGSDGLGVTSSTLYDVEGPVE